MKMKVIKKPQSIFSRLSKNASIALRSASLVSEHFKEKNISVMSIFVGILLNEDNLATKVIEEMDLDRSEILKDLFDGKILEITGDTSGAKLLSFSPEAQEVFRKAFDYAQRMSHVYVGTEHLMLAVLASKDEKIAELKRRGLSYRTFRKSLSMVAMYPIGLLTKPGYRDEDGEEDRILDYLGIDLVEMAKEGKLDPVIGRESEIDHLINILSRRKKNNPLIIGEAGVGKTVLVESLAQRIADGKVPLSLKDMRIVLLDVASIMAGSKMRGDIEEKVMSIVQDVISGNNTILFIDEIHNIVSPGGLPGSSSDIASVLKPALLRDEFRCIGATTTEEYSSTFESDNALARRFQPIFLKEMSQEDTVDILRNITPLLEKHHNVTIEEKAIEAAVSLSDRYVTDRYLPDKAIDLLDEAAASKRLKVEGNYEGLSSLESKLKKTRETKEIQITKGNMEKALKLQEKEESLEKEIAEMEKECLKKKKSTRNSVDIEDVKTVISKWTGIPHTLGREEREALLKLEDKLNESVVGQEEACSVVASAIKRARTGLIDTDRPWASFLFLGPTGVGKTELAKVLTKELFGDEDRLIQIDMSEMMEMHSVSKLIGSPPGYIGYQHGGFLTEQVKKNPHSVILFDEVEKAHPDVLNILLQVLEYGHLTDGRGRKVNFKNTIVILTSNIGAEEIRQDKVLGFGKESSEKRKDEDIDDAYESMKNILLDELRQSLRPELLNRLDDIVIFRSLTRKDARKIVKLLLKDLNQRLQEEKIKVKLDRKVVTYIIKNAFSEEYGARPLRRYLQDKVENALADYMLENSTLFNHEEREKVETILMVLDKKGDKIIVKQEK